jgi:hypothetical protein
MWRWRFCWVLEFLFGRVLPDDFFLSAALTIEDLVAISEFVLSLEASDLVTQVGDLFTGRRIVIRPVLASKHHRNADEEHHPSASERR